jgi:hypothetical protein
MQIYYVKLKFKKMIVAVLLIFFVFVFYLQLLRLKRGI